jgi:hypothetical protein
VPCLIYQTCTGDFFPEFKKSQQFKTLQEDVSSLKQAKPEERRQRNHSFLALVKFKTDRHLLDIEDDIEKLDFETVIQDSLGRHYLKRYGRELFQVDKS